MNRVRGLWRILRTRRLPDIREIAALRDAHQFLDAAFTAAAGNLAIAAVFLPPASRTEGAVAHLCCRALDACEDLAESAEEAKSLLRHCIAYLSGATNGEFAPISDVPQRYSDQLEHLILSRLCWLRSALARLPAFRQQRVRRLVAEVGEGMAGLAEARRTRDPGQAAEYADRVLGKVVKYSVELLGIPSRWTIDYGSIAQVAQTANDLRDRHFDCHIGAASPPQELFTLLLSAMEPATSVTSALSGFRFSKISRARAAVVYVVATSTRFYLRIIGVPLTKRLQSPLRTALTCMISPGAYATFLVELENLITVCATTVCSSLFAGPRPSLATDDVAPRAGRRLSEFETSLALSWPSPSAALALSRAVDMARTAATLRANLPVARLTSEEGVNGPLASILLSDYLFGAAVLRLQPLGLEVLAGFAEFLATEAENSERTGALADERGELAAFLTRIVMSANGQYGHGAPATEIRNRSLGQFYHRQDRKRPSLTRRPLLSPLTRADCSVSILHGAPITSLTSQNS
jgi:phytoene/squalene synthetase